MNIIWEKLYHNLEENSKNRYVIRNREKIDFKGYLLFYYSPWALFIKEKKIKISIKYL
jgi:hypothetical protein